MFSVTHIQYVWVTILHWNNKVHPKSLVAYNFKPRMTFFMAVPLHQIQSQTTPKRQNRSIVNESQNNIFDSFLHIYHTYCISLLESTINRCTYTQSLKKKNVVNVAKQLRFGNKNRVRKSCFELNIKSKLSCNVTPLHNSLNNVVLQRSLTI